MPDFTKCFIIEADASGFGLGAVLLQEGHPIAYFSKVLGPRGRLKSIYEKELMAIVLAVLKWKHYLLGRHFVIRTDQQSLKYLMEQREVGPEYQRWVSKLMAYNFTILYKSGATNRVADALSREFWTEVELGALLVSGGSSWVEYASDIRKHEFISQLTSDIQQGRAVPTGYHLEHGDLKYKGRLVLPPKSALIATILHDYHDSPLGGHSGDFKTYKRIASDWFWPGMRKEIAQYVRQCSICQQAKSSTLSPGGLLQPLSIPTLVWDAISMDFVEGLPTSHGWNTVLVVVDRLTKYSHFIPLKHPYTAASVAEVFVREVVKHHGFPTTIVSDRDRVFVSLFWAELFKLQGTLLHKSTAYHPQSDGQTEVVNKSLETYLRCFIQDHPKSWSKWLAWAEFWYNTSTHSSTGFSPFQALYGRPPPQIMRYHVGDTAVASLEDRMLERDGILDELKANLVRAQHRMKVQEDLSRREVVFTVGEMVYLKLHPYRQRSVVRRSFEKLAAKYYGPFPVLQRVGAVAYKLQLPPESRIHPVFHVSLLKKSVGPVAVSSTLPQMGNESFPSDTVPEQLLGVREGPAELSGAVEVLIKWQGQPKEEATWESYDHITAFFPSFHLEDKVSVWARGNAKDQPKSYDGVVYRRRPKTAAQTTTDQSP
ncbi:hypothetical protein DCAR_0520152 [Daucus carota subsp. sativus]|uniref:Integrase catalytic domain-containing protein n=1 Tax=Daucus carota subsp. sativus TaxID=79200 RepID=A0AAF0X5G7_DAUCS|nr:hypothetical protein DCAR_0520152 [Daucus carota subsp. sativus]